MNIYDFITTEESRFETEEMRVGNNMNWNFKNHVQLIFHLKMGYFFTGENNYLRSFKNIFEPILNLAYWAEDIEVKDIVFFIENKTGRALSFLFKKYHDEIYVKDKDLDELLDRITEDDLDFGGVLVQKGKDSPEVLELQSIAFCDQTDILAGPIGFKLSFSPDKLRKMSKLGWGDVKNGATTTIEDLIKEAENERSVAGSSYQQKNRTTGKNIEVYIVKGSLPLNYLEETEEESYENQMHIVAFYSTDKGERKGSTLYKNKWDESELMFFTNKEVYGRALGRGEGEALIHPQVWTNFLEIHKMALLEAGAKVPLYTDDANFGNRNQIQDMENLELMAIDSESRFGIRQVPTVAPANIQLYSQSIEEWFNHAQLTGAAFDPLLGKQSPSGTTFRGQERTVFQGRGLHERRRGRRAKFIEKIYRTWIIPDIKRKILGGKEFLAELSSEEMTWLTDQLAENLAIKTRNEQVLNGQIPEPKEPLIEKFKIQIQKKGNRHLLKILKEEFKNVEIKLGINVSAKQKDLLGMTDKVLSIFQFVFSNPEGFQKVMQIPGMERAFQDILEFSGISPANFAGFKLPLPAPEQPLPVKGTSVEPLQALAPVQ